MKFITSLFFTCGLIFSIQAQESECVTLENSRTTYNPTLLVTNLTAYFDVEASKPVVLNDISLNATAPIGFGRFVINKGKYKVYSIAGSAEGLTVNPATWTYEGSYTGTGATTACGFSMRHFLAPGQRRGFAVVPDNGTVFSIHQSAVANLVPTDDLITAENADIVWHSNKIEILGTTFNRNTYGSLCYTQCKTENSFTLYGLNAGWVNAGANDPNVFYYGLSDAKKITATTSGGVGPYTYQWSASSGTVLVRSYYPGNTIDFKAPTEASYVYVTITDEGNGCQMTDSVFVDWSDEFYCYTINNVPYFKVCNDFTEMCVPWTKENRDKIFNSTYTLGGCNNEIPQKASFAAHEGFTLYPNPSNGVFSVNFDGLEYSTAQMDVLDLNGRVLMSSQVEAGTFATTIDLSNFTNGLYLVRLSSKNGIQTEKIQILH